MQSAGRKKSINYIYLAMFTALAMALQWAEMLIPAGGVVPGGKLGLANIVTIIVFKVYGFRYGAAVSVVRCCLGAVLFGGVMSLPYSLGGAVASLCVMAAVAFVPGVSNAGMAIAGAFAHNCAQVAVACLIMQNTHIAAYIFPLGFVSVIAGAFTGICATLCINRINLYLQGGSKNE